MLLLLHVLHQLLLMLLEDLLLSLGDLIWMLLLLLSLLLLHHEQLVLLLLLELFSRLANVLLDLSVFIDDSHLDLLARSVWFLFDLLWHLELVRRLSSILLLDLSLLLLFLDLLLNLLERVLFKS
jgi:hypothetical protein